MKDIIQKIISCFFKPENTPLTYEWLEKDAPVLVIKDIQGEPADFFLFEFCEEKDLEAISVNDKEALERMSSYKISEQELGAHWAFDKNLNRLIFVECENDQEVSEESKKLAYQIEENPYFFRKKVTFYTGEQEKSFDNYSMDLSCLGTIDSALQDSGPRFVLNLLSALSFLKIKFPSQDSQQNDIFHKSYQELLEKHPTQKPSTYLDFNKKIQQIYNDGGIKINSAIATNTLTKLEKDLLDLFGDDEWKLLPITKQFQDENL